MSADTAPAAARGGGTGRRVAVVGAGWAGLAAAVQSHLDGHEVQVFEMAPQPGGRARRGFAAEGVAYDNGQHILIGAYRDTLQMMRAVGVDPDAVLHRQPLALRYPDGRGLALPAGPPPLAFLRGVLAMPGYSWGERWALLRVAGGWARAGFACPADWTVSTLCAALPPRIRRDLFDPLCVAALNTPASSASAAVLLTVLQDALFAVRGGSDLLLPRTDLSSLFPGPALAWLRARGVPVQLGHRVEDLVAAEGAPGAPDVGQPRDGTWRLAGRSFDAVVLAAGPLESARLAQPHAPAWAAAARALPFEPIATVYARAGAGSPSPGLAWPMVALDADARWPAQYAFDLGRLRDDPRAGLAFVISGAAPWVAQGREALVQAVVDQARSALGLVLDAQGPGFRLVIEKRATFLCTPGLLRPHRQIAPGLLAAGDYVAGPYPATLEGAVRSGLQAAAELAAA